jgi:winged helix DNA-binding protein
VLATETSAQQVFARTALETGLLADPSKKRKPLVAVIAAMGGLRSERLDQAHLILSARYPDYRPESLLRALQERRTLVRTWGIRGELQILPTAQLGLFLAASAITAPRWKRFLDARSSLATPARLRLLKRLCPETVSRDALRDSIPDPTTRLFMLREAAQAGQIVWKDGDGAQSTFAWTQSWLGREVEAERDLTELVGRYLTSFGPVAATDLGPWLGVTVAAARSLMAKHRVEEVQVEGEEAQTFMKPEDLEVLVQTRKSLARGYVVVPAGDPVLLAHRVRYRQSEQDAEDIGLVFLDGRPVSTWTIEQNRINVRDLDGVHHLKARKAVLQVVHRAGIAAELADPTS